MKKLVLAAFALTTAASVFAQGTIIFVNRSTLGTSHIYQPLAPGSTVHQIGNGPTDGPSGSTDWTGYVGVGAGGLNGLYGGTTTFAQVLAANGFNQTEGSLSPQGVTTTFRTGAGAGFIAQASDTLGNVPKDSAGATLEIVAWDNSSGLYSTWTQASVAWAAGLIAAGESGPVNVALIGGDVNTPPNFNTPSFNLYFTIPEPSTFALAGLGAAAMLIFRRRK